jgi:phosphatidylserine/phosphatidylglycerophosphate/cardiolipin synthase-like enzyme
MTLRRLLKQLALIGLLMWAITMVWQTNKPLPDGVHINATSMFPVNEVRFLFDLTYRTARGEPRNEQQIFAAVLKQIDEAQHFIVLDYFLFNDDPGDATPDSRQLPLRKLSRELTDHLLARKRAEPALQVLFITDPINDIYGGAPSALLAELQRAGIQVVRTDLTALRDSNPAYSAVWRGWMQWWGNSSQGGWLPNPFNTAAPPVTLRSWLQLFNFKANHRKLIVSDRADGAWQAIITSANPHDASSAHSNVALQVSGKLAEQIVESELNVARFSGWHGTLQLPTQNTSTNAVAGIEARYLTEDAILETVSAAIRGAEAGDHIQLAMFYLSQRDIIHELKLAADRQVQVRLILDPNKDAFGISKDGVPNRPVATELVQQGHGNIAVRWYRTNGEQFHAKLLMIQHRDQLFVTLGSANFTRRNLNDYNLEANVALELPAGSDLAQQFNRYFERIWSGDDRSPEYTAPFGAYQDDSMARYWRYRLMEATGLSTF